MSKAVRLQRKAKGERPYFFEDPSVDKLLTMLMALAGEVSVMRDRLDTVERLAQERGLFKQKDIESYQPSDEVLAARAARREEFLSEITRIIQAELEGLQSDDDRGSYDEAVALVEKDLKT
ncbi:MAG: hypothetical protein ACREUU_21040 [Gammaproteobacteria bacterium]